jgi:MFS family permease
MYNTNWYLGSIISAWACFGSYIRAKESMWSWRVPTLVQAFLPLVQVASVWFIPESPRWLISRGLEEKASKVLAKYHANGGNEHDPLVVFEVAQIRHAIKMEAEINRRTSYWSLFSTPGNRKRMMIIMAIAIFSQWSGNGLVSYYINIVLDGVGITSAAAKGAINGNLQIFNFLVALSASMLVDWAGRRTLFIVSNSGMLISFSAWTISTALYNTLHTPAAGIGRISSSLSMLMC